jgi:hypothetical protein
MLHLLQYRSRNAQNVVECVHQYVASSNMILQCPHLLWYLQFIILCLARGLGVDINYGAEEVLHHLGSLALSQFFDLGELLLCVFVCVLFHFLVAGRVLWLKLISEPPSAKEN